MALRAGRAGAASLTAEGRGRRRERRAGGTRTRGGASCEILLIHLYFARFDYKQRALAYQSAGCPPLPAPLALEEPMGPPGAAGLGSGRGDHGLAGRLPDPDGPARRA